MNFSELGFIAVIVIGLSTFVLLLSKSWRWQTGALGFQYLSVFILVAVSWPLDLAAVKLVAGWMGASILGISRFYRPGEETEDVEVGVAFRITTTFLIFITVWSTAPKSLVWIPSLEINQAWGGILLIGMGLLMLGFYSYGPRVIYGLLTMISGFEIIYSVVEVSTLVASLMALVTIGISFVGAFLVSNSASGDLA